MEVSEKVQCSAEHEPGKSLTPDIPEIELEEIKPYNIAKLVVATNKTMKLNKSTFNKLIVRNSETK